MYVTRTLETFAKTAAGQFPILLITGARQVGKTTFLKHLSESKRTYVTLDDPLVLKLAKTDPAMFFQKYDQPLLIDEIQYAPELLPYIKIMVDADKKTNQFWLTGSQQFHLMKGVSESLAGRVAVIQLMGMSKPELERHGSRSRPFLPTVGKMRDKPEKITLKRLYHLIWRGSFPAVALNSKLDWRLFYSSYVQTYLQRDVRDLARVGDQSAFLRFLRAVAARTGQMLSLTELAKDTDCAVNTAKNWLSILEASGIVYLLQPYFTNISKRLIKTPKLYMLDTGLCSYLTEWSTPETLEAGAMSGAILETWVIAELLKSYWHNGRTAPFYYYRNKDQNEIDLLIIQDRTIYPLEIKKTASPSLRDVRHFKALETLKMTIGPGGVICMTSEFLPLSKNIQAIPISAI